MLLFPVTKFFVVDADSLGAFQYASDGSSLANNSLAARDSKPRGIASNADGSIQWVVDDSGDVYVYDKNGTQLGQWRLDRVGTPEGITVWGNDLWIVDANDDIVHKFIGGANLRSGRVQANSTFALNGSNRDATDLVTDGAHLWVVNDTVGVDSVFRYTVGGALEGSWNLSTTNPSPTGITLDPSSVFHIWTVDASTDRVYQYDAATTRLSGSQEPSVSFALAASNTNPQGIADPLPAARVPVVSATLVPPVTSDVWRQRVDATLAEFNVDDSRFTRKPLQSNHETNHGRSYASVVSSDSTPSRKGRSRPNDNVSSVNVDDLTASHRSRSQLHAAIDEVFSQIGQLMS